MNNELKIKLEQIYHGIVYVENDGHFLTEQLIYKVFHLIERSLENENEAVQINDLINCFEAVRKEK